MKKIKIITCHDVYNAGASLQAYALSEYLSNNNYSVEIIDYKPLYLRHYYFWRVNKKFDKNVFTRLLYYVLKVPKRIIISLTDKRKKSYDKFTKNYLRLTKKTFYSNEELVKKIPVADIYIAGSDQIWNPLLDNGNDPSFYLNFAPENKNKVAYAASFSVEKLPDENSAAFVKEQLSRFDNISVREKSGVDIVSSLGYDSVNVLDPVFLLSAEEWGNMCYKKAFNDDYVLVYDFDNNQSIKKLAKTIALNNNCKIFSVLKCDYADKSFEECGPDCFVSLVKNSKFVISNSFHATAFSIIFHKEFCVFNRSWSINTRMNDLLSVCDLQNQLINEDLNNVEIKTINWEDVDIKLNENIKYSKDYLKVALEK